MSLYSYLKNRKKDPLKDKAEKEEPKKESFPRCLRKK